MTAEEMGLEPGTPEYAEYYAGTGVLTAAERANKAAHQLAMANPFAVTSAGSSVAQGQASAAAYAAAAAAEQAVQLELERRRGPGPIYRAPLPAGASADPTVATAWNPTPTNYNPTPGQTDMERQLAAIAAAEAAQRGIIQQLEERRVPLGTRAIDELGGSAQFTDPLMNSEEEPVSFLGGIVGGAAKFLSGGAKALLESRRETSPASSFAMQAYQDPAAVPGMPSYSQASVVPWGAVGQTIGRVASTLGTAATAYMAGQAILGPGGNKGVIMGAVSPRKVNRATLTCPPKYVLGVDGQCYPKSMIPRSARKWTPDPKPVVSRSDQKAITRAASAKKRLVKLTNAAGAHATITRPHKHTSSRKK